MDDKLIKFCVSLYDVGCLKFGKFTLKSKTESVYYIDLRILISYPSLMGDLCSLLNNLIVEKNITFDTVCGVPYTALPISTIISFKSNKPMVMRRKEPKSYGTKQHIEGIFEKGSRCIIIEDVISTGSSILETVTDIENAGMIVKDVIVVVNREEQGVKNLKDRGYNVHCLYSLSEVVRILLTKNKIDLKMVEKIEIQKNLWKTSNETKESDRLKLPFEKRIEYCNSTVAAKLFSLMAEKKTNLCLAADLVDIKDLLNLADEVGPHICILKIHTDIIHDYSDKERNELKAIAKRHNFMIMEDRKLADIGNTVRLQFNQLSKWANLVTAHSLPGFGVLEAIKQAENYNEDAGVFLIAELSCANSLITPDYTKKTMLLAEKYSELVAGIVCQFSTTVTHPGYVQMTPGVCLEEHVKSDDLGQQYNTPENVIITRGADVAVVGRGILNASKPAQKAVEYKKKLWDAYLTRIQ